MKVLVTYAVEPEFAPWRRLRNLAAKRAGDLTVSTAQIGRASVTFVVTGMGAENAVRAANAAMREPYTICICAGFCGALKAGHTIGDILAPDFIQELHGHKVLECSRNLVYAARADGAKAAKRFFTVPEIISTAEEKARLAPYADAVDMESFGVVQVAREHKVSVAVIRVVSDRFDQDVAVDFGTTIDDNGSVSVRGVVRFVARHPLQLPALIRLGRQSRTAAQGLASFLEAYIKKLSFHSHGWPPVELSEIAAQ